MKKILVITVVLLGLCFSPLTWSADNDAVEQLNRLIAPIKTLSGEFQQTITAPDGKILQTTNGRMYLERPWKFRWEMGMPAQQVIVANGQKLYDYNVDLKQITVQPLGSNTGETPALLFSGNKEDLIKNFVVTTLDSDEPGVLRFKLIPKEKGGLLQEIRVIYINSTLAEMQFLDNSDQITILKFTQIKNNAHVSSKLFKFDMPKGVDVIDQTVALN